MMHKVYIDISVIIIENRPGWILFSRQCLDFSRGLCPVNLPVKILQNTLRSPVGIIGEPL